MEVRLTGYLLLGNLLVSKLALATCQRGRVVDGGRPWTRLRQPWRSSTAACNVHSVVLLRGHLHETGVTEPSSKLRHCGIMMAALRWRPVVDVNLPASANFIFVDRFDLRQLFGSCRSKNEY
jgi:hypothetical protein